MSVVKMARRLRTATAQIRKSVSEPSWPVSLFLVREFGMVIDGPEQRSDLLLLQMVNGIHQGLGPRRFFRGMSTKLQGFVDQPVIDLQVGRHGHHLHTDLYAIDCVPSRMMVFGILKC